MILAWTWRATPAVSHGPDGPGWERDLSTDYLIAGAGSAGGVLARRLVDRGFGVHLIESGPGDDGWPMLAVTYEAPHRIPPGPSDVPEGQLITSSSTRTAPAAVSALLHSADPPGSGFTIAAGVLNAQSRGRRSPDVLRPGRGRAQ